jgi:large subunit ribosomal protein L4
MSTNRTVDVWDASGTKSGTAQLPGELFDATTNVALIHQVVTAQQAAARQGTHATKTRGDRRGGSAKPYRQKGTGRARQGSVRAPQYVGGGIVHGPQPRNYAQRTPKKMVSAALRGALSDRARNGRVAVVNSLVTGAEPSTKQAVSALSEVTQARNVLVVLSRAEDLAWLSLRNVVNVATIVADQLNAYDVLVADDVVFTADALATFVAGPVSAKPAGAAAGGDETEDLAQPDSEAVDDARQEVAQ